MVGPITKMYLKVCGHKWSQVSTTHKICRINCT